MTKTKHLSIRISEELEKAIIEKATSAKRGKTDWVRLVLMRAVK